MYIDSKLFKRFFDITMDQLMDERGPNRFELIMKNPEMKKTTARFSETFR